VRLLAIARQRGCYASYWRELPPGRIAEHLLDIEKEIVGELTIEELTAVAERLGMAISARRKPELVRQLLKPRKTRSILRKYGDLPEQIEDEENKDLRAWVEYYIRCAETEGYRLDFSNDSGTDISHEGTIRLVCQLWPFAEWPDWLMWQRYDGPVGRGPWWLACNFEQPVCWFNGRMILRNPWDFAFSDLFMAADEENIAFRLCKPHGQRITDGEHKWLAGAVLDGLRYEYEDDEFILACAKTPKSLTVYIYNPLLVEMKKSDKRSKDGIFWD
jgi:hypothetical protein